MLQKLGTMDLKLKGVTQMLADVLEREEQIDPFLMLSTNHEAPHLRFCAADLKDIHKKSETYVKDWSVTQVRRLHEGLAHFQN